MDEDYVKAMELHIKALKKEIEGYDRDIIDAEETIQINKEQRDVSYKRLNKAFRELDEYKSIS